MLDLLHQLKNQITDLKKEIITIDDDIDQLINPIDKVKLFKMKLKKQIRINNLVNKIDFIQLI